MKSVFVRAVTTSIALMSAALAEAQSVESRPSLRTGASNGAIQLDGLLDEPSWAAAEIMEDFTLIEPTQGGMPTGRTRVRVIASREALYIGVTCDDPDASGIVSFTKQRDGDLGAEDNIRVVLDTFLDGRSGYVFQVNPSGARYDALVDQGGDDENSNWDGIWDAGTHRDERGWSAEIWIPIQTLSFDSASTSWYFNVERRIQRLQETARWASPRRDWRFTQTSRAGLLTELPALTQGRGLTIRPSVTVGSGIPAPGVKHEEIRDPSLDISQRLGSNLLSQLSIKTDFAESDVDTRRTNLTRFPLFFPETRTFFVEGSDLFQFGLGLGENVVPFFSRRVGLVSGRKVPILAATKINGRVGATNVGGVVARTESVDDLVPASTMAVARVRRSIWRESSIGMITTVGDPLGRSGSWTAGPDFTYQTSRFRGDKNFRVGMWGLLMDRQGATRDKSAMGFRVEYPNDRWDISAHTIRIGDGFDPSLGFVQRVGIYNYRFEINNTLRPEKGPIQQMEHEFRNSVITDLRGKWESYRVMIAPLNWRLDSGDRVEFNVVPTGENLPRAFEVADGVDIPAGPYHWRRYRIEGRTAEKRKYSGEVTWWFGGFYSGRLDEIQLTGTLHPSPLFTVELSAERNIGDLKEGRFTQTFVGARGRVNVSPDLQVSSYIQYDTDSRSVGSNTRLRWTFQALGDLFVIYNHNVRDIEQRWQLDSNQLLVKLQYAFRY